MPGYSVQTTQIRTFNVQSYIPNNEKMDSLETEAKEVRQIWFDYFGLKTFEKRGRRTIPKAKCVLEGNPVMESKKFVLLLLHVCAVSAVMDGDSPKTAFKKLSLCQTIGCFALQTFNNLSLYFPILTTAGLSLFHISPRRAMWIFDENSGY